MQFPESVSIVHLDWILPQKNETIRSYAQRLAEPIDRSRPFCLVGLSFGGMIAVEMAKFLSPQQVFIISSTPVFHGIPILYRRLGATGIHKMFPFRLLRQVRPLVFWLFRAKSETEKQLVRSIILEADPQFMQWAITTILNWKNEVIPENLYHVHGTEDRILPLAKPVPHVALKGAGHLMVFTHGTKVAALILKKLEN
jgi:hypothetical protein